MTQTKFTVDGRDYSIQLNYWKAAVELPEKHGINIVSMFSNEEEALSTMQSLALDDMLVIDLMIYFMGEDKEKETLLKSLIPEEVEQFREKFWDAVAAFSGPLKRELVLKMWRMLKTEIKQADLQTPTLEESSSPLNQEG